MLTDTQISTSDHSPGGVQKNSVYTEIWLRPTIKIYMTSLNYKGGVSH